MKAQCFIDGYNLYHAIDDLRCPKLHWVNLRELFKSYLPNACELNDVFYFTAKPVHLKIPTQNRHSDFIKAQKLYDVSVVEGQFKRKQLTCRANGVDACLKKFTAHEEKESDVNLALQIVNEAHLDNFDIAIVVTADSDLLPPIKFVRENFPDKEVWLLSPPKRKNHSQELSEASTRTIEITSKQLRNKLMHEDIRVNHEIVVSRPSDWSRERR